MIDTCTCLLLFNQYFKYLWNISDCRPIILSSLNDIVCFFYQSYTRVVQKVVGQIVLRHHKASN
jgi:hypothetical protein